MSGWQNSSWHNLKKLLDGEGYFSLLVWMNIAYFFHERIERQSIWGAYPAVADGFMKSRRMVFSARNLNTTTGPVAKGLDRETNDTSRTSSDERPWRHHHVSANVFRFIEWLRRLSQFSRVLLRKSPDIPLIHAGPLSLASRRSHHPAEAVVAPSPEPSV